MAWAFKSEAEETNKPGQNQAAPASLPCEQPEVQGNAFRAFQSLCRRFTACNFNFIHCVPVSITPASLTFQLSEKWDNLTELTLGFDDFQELRVDYSEVRYNDMTVVVKTTGASRAKGQKFVFGFHYGKPGDPFPAQAEAESAARGFAESLGILIHCPASRVDAYGAKYQAALQAYRDAGGRMSLPEAARRYFVQAEGAFKDKNYSHAMDLYYQGLLAAPWFPRGHFNLAILLAEQGGDYAEAVNEMKKYLELSPEASDARDAQDKIYLWEDKAQAAPVSAPSGQKEDDLQQRIHLKEELAK
jgi:tetratricopeptide (TPR) repeat protein